MHSVSRTKKYGTFVILLFNAYSPILSHFDHSINLDTLSNTWNDFSFLFINKTKIYHLWSFFNNCCWNVKWATTPLQQYKYEENLVG